MASACIACEQQTHFRRSLLSLRKGGKSKSEIEKKIGNRVALSLRKGGREATTGNASAVRRLLLAG